MVGYNHFFSTNLSEHPRRSTLPCLAPPRSFVPPFPRSFWSKPARPCDARRRPIDPCSGSSWRCWWRTIPTGSRRDWAVASACRAARCSAGGNAGRREISPSRTWRDAAARPIFPPRDHALVKALACERVAETGQPLSRQSLHDLTARARTALGQPISRSTVWRILNQDAIKPWRYKHWIFPRDPQFVEKAGRILDLYEGRWEGKSLGRRDYILSADEKTSIQARLRIHPSLGPAPGRFARIESEYERGGALQYLAAWDVRRGYVTGRCEPKTGIEPFGRLVRQVLAQPPYRSARRLFWIVDNGSSHRGQAARQRLRGVDARIILVHTPVHASWLNQVEIYFSILQRKVLTPNDFPNLHAVQVRLALYEDLSNQCPTPFAWKFDRRRLADLFRRLERREKLLTGQAPTQKAAVA